MPKKGHCLGREDRVGFTIGNQTDKEWKTDVVRWMLQLKRYVNKQKMLYFLIGRVVDNLQLAKMFSALDAAAYY